MKAYELIEELKRNPEAEVMVTKTIVVQSKEEEVIAARRNDRVRKAGYLRSSRL